MVQKIIIRTADAIYEGETHKKEVNQLTISNCRRLNGTQGEQRNLQLSDITRIYLFDVSTSDAPSSSPSPSPSQPHPAAYSIVVSGEELDRKVRMITLSLEEYLGIESRLASRRVDPTTGLNLLGVQRVAVAYEVANKRLVSMSVDTGREIVSFSFDDAPVNMALVRRIFEDASLVKVMHNGRVFKSCLSEKVKFVNVFDTMITHLMLNSSRPGKPPKSMVPVERVCQGLLGLPWQFFRKDLVVAYLLPVYYRQETILGQSFEHRARSFQFSVALAQDERAKQFAAAPWIVSDEVRPN